MTMTVSVSPPENPPKLSTWERIQLEKIYEEFRKRDDAPEVLREYLHYALGRILP